MDPSCWDSSRAVLPGNIVKGQSVSSLCFLAAQVPTLQMKASHQKPIHFLAITAWNQAGDLAASDFPCYIQETEVYLACQFLSTVLVSLSWYSSFLQSFYLLCKQNAGGDSSRCCHFLWRWRCRCSHEHLYTQFFKILSWLSQICPFNISPQLSYQT